jgi:hypothetical protein
MTMMMPIGDFAARDKHSVPYFVGADTVHGGGGRGWKEVLRHSSGYASEGRSKPAAGAAQAVDKETYFSACGRMSLLAFI